MIILNKPYISDYLIETIKKNNFKVLDNEISKKYFDENNLVDDIQAINLMDKELFYSNSENSIEWIEKNCPNSKLNNMIKICKDKAVFREKLKPLFVDFQFKKITYQKLKTLDVSELKYPFVLKPTVGFLSFGVYPVRNMEDWQNVLLTLDKDIKNLEGIFPSNVVNMSSFIIEEMIEGEEYAIDAYYDKFGKATILNIFQHPFLNEKDVSDRVYYTSVSIIKKYYEKFQDLLDKIGELCGFKNFPFHLELRVSEKNIIPIEINPLRFCGWCITDIAQNAWDINVYEKFFKQEKVDWNKILDKKEEEIYYFTIGDIPSGFNKEDIKVNYESYLRNIANPLVVRKINYKVNPVFAIVFAKAKDMQEIEEILKLDMKKFIA